MSGHMIQRTVEPEIEQLHLLKNFENIKLMNYFKSEVQVDRQKTEKVLEDVLPKMKNLVKYINSKDEHFDAEAVSVGSYTQGLGVNANRDYDLNVVFRYNPRVESNRIVWNPNIRFLNYDFESQNKKTVSIFDPNVKIVRTSYALPHPGTGYLWVHLGYEVPGFTFDGDLIPFYVQRKFGQLLQDAMKCKDPSGILNLSPKLHGPALKIDTEVKTDDGIKHPVSIDLSVIIRAQLPFLPEMGWPVPDMNITRAQPPFQPALGWPVPYVKWPPKDKIQAIIEKGINAVAKNEFFWQQSFAELEKLLVKEIDKDGGCRKIVHRIMKSVYYTVCDDKSSLSTYILKNVWFHECEQFPYSYQWVDVRLGERYLSCLQRLIDCSRKGVLWQYFDRRVNLLKKRISHPTSIRYTGSTSVHGKLNKALTSTQDTHISCQTIHLITVCS